MNEQYVNFDGSKIDRAVSFWQKYRTYLIPLISLLLGAVGGNADRVSSYVSQNLVGNECHCQPAGPDNPQGVKVEFNRSYNK